MTAIIGYNVWGYEPYQSPSPSVRKLFQANVKNAIYDEISIREKTNFNPTNIRDTWQIDHKLLAKFAGDLEAGNVQNEGLQIVKFAIKRRKRDDLNSLTLDYMDFTNNSTLEYTDYTQPSGRNLVYSIVPVGENELEGKPNDITVDSEFTGWFIVDKDTNNVLSFDKFIESESAISLGLNQGRTTIETLSKYPQVYYDDREYHTFSLSTVILADEWGKSSDKYKNLLDNFIRNHKPMIVKSGNGKLFICDTSKPQVSEPLNTWDGRDYFTITIDLLEIQDYDDFMNE